MNFVSAIKRVQTRTSPIGPPRSSLSLASLCGRKCHSVMWTAVTTSSIILSFLYPLLWSSHERTPFLFTSSYPISSALRYYCCGGYNLFWWLDTAVKVVDQLEFQVLLRFWISQQFTPQLSSSTCLRCQLIHTEYSHSIRLPSYIYWNAKIIPAFSNTDMLVEVDTNSTVSSGRAAASPHAFLLVWRLYSTSVLRKYHFIILNYLFEQ